MDILYEDQDILAIMKPAGMVVNQSQTWSGETVQEWLKKKMTAEKWLTTEGVVQEWTSLLPLGWTTEFGTAEDIFQERWGIAHRLDKETSGVLLVGKNPGALVNLLFQFKQRQVSKKYLALVHGKLPIKEDRISLPLGRKTSNRLRWAVKSTGKLAVTDYVVTQEWSGIKTDQLLALMTKNGDSRQWTVKKINDLYQGFSLVECGPKTGRTHQIRVHLAHLHHPIVADQVYESEKRRKLDDYWCPRHFLHATELEFEHPRTGKVMKVKAPLPIDLRESLMYLRD